MPKSSGQRQQKLPACVQTMLIHTTSSTPYVHHCLTSLCPPFTHAAVALAAVGSRALLW